MKKVKPNNASSLVYRLVRKALSGIIFVFPNKHLTDFVLWPLSRRLLPRNYSEIITLGNGIRMWVYQDIYDMTNKTLMFFGQGAAFPYEHGTSMLFATVFKDKNCGLVAGGHLGYFALLAAKSNPQAQIYVFEPTKKMFDRLVRNIELNGYTNIHAEHKALTKVAGEVEIVVDNGQSSLVRHAGNTMKEIESVEGIPVDTYFENKGHVPDFMLLDVEGFELSVLEGAGRVLESKPDLVLEINSKMLHNAGTNEKAIRHHLVSRGYTVSIIDEMDGELNHRYFNIFATAR